jgi:hypothetical protein
MNIETQIKVLNNSNVLRYLRQNSYWYKILNRNPESFDVLVEEMKKAYKLNTEDKLESIAEKIKMVQMFMNIFR